MNKVVSLFICFLVLGCSEDQAEIKRPKIECLEFKTVQTSRNTSYPECVKTGDLICIKPLELYTDNNGKILCKLKEIK